jgi:TATA-box binding protein (TBP) (component of TFIID and TFIIIB)
MVVDPWGTRRLLHDAVLTRDTLRAQAQVLRTELAAVPLNPEGGLHECLTTVADDDATDVMHIYLVNMVHQCYCGTEPGAVTDDASLVMEEGNDADDDADALADVEEDTITLPVEKETRPSILSLRYLQRHWLLLGYNKNEVGMGIGVRFAPPYVASHITFTTGRELCTGGNNRVVDGLLLRHGTTAFLRAIGMRTLRVQRRVCQNLVGKCWLRAPQGLCLSLLCARHRNMITKTKRFVGVKLHHPNMPLARQLAFMSNRVVCIGCKRPHTIKRVFARMAPIYRANYRTPANTLLEEQMIAAGVVERIGPAPPPPPPVAVVPDAMDVDEPADIVSRDANAGSSDSDDDDDDEESPPVTDNDSAEVPEEELSTSHEEEEEEVILLPTTAAASARRRHQQRVLGAYMRSSTGK